MKYTLHLDKNASYLHFEHKNKKVKLTAEQKIEFENEMNSIVTSAKSF